MDVPYHDFDDDEDDEEDLQLTLIKSRSEASSPWGHNFISNKVPNVEEDEESEEDSDAEFAVHPILRSLIKSKSAYTVPATSQPIMKNSKTTFEMNLSKMWTSVNECILNQTEPPVVNCTSSNIDEKWPEPDDMSAGESGSKSKIDKKMFKPSDCWSSPPNIAVEDSTSLASFGSFNNGRASCWSAPEYEDPEEVDDDPEDDFDDDEVIVEVEEGRVDYFEQDENLDPNVSQPHLLFSTSYPVIETPDPVSSLCSIRLPSSSGSAPSPSPPRPLSPVLGKPGVRMSSSRSLQLRPRPRLEELIYDDVDNASGIDEDDDDDGSWPQKDPWPQQEVWPEENLIHRPHSNGWLENDIPRSVSVQFRSNHSRMLPNSNSAHAHIHGVELEDDTTDIQKSTLKMNSSQHNSSANSSTHMLSETERCELARRSAWLERGSLVQLSTGVDWPNYQLSSTSTGSIRRSCTTDEFRRPRRRLPRRPDDVSYRGDLPCSMSMYDKILYEQQFGSNPMIQRAESLRSSIHVLNNPEPARIISNNDVDSRRRPPSSLPIQESTPRCHSSALSQAVPPKIVPYPPANYQNKSSTRPYTEPETPMSPPKHLLPSPHSTGRRLPPLPLNSTYLARLPATMSVPQPPAAVPKNDHTLCFIDGMTDSVLARSTFEESYYEDDTINGNSSYRRQRKSFFSPDDSSGVSSCTTSDSLNPTHRVQSAFIPRHPDEVVLEIGDAVHVERSCEDHWCFGTNLRTGQSGIFPAAVVCEIDLVEEICLGALPTNTNKVLTTERDTFYLTMLASIEVAHHKGNDVLTQAMNKVLALYKNREEIIVPQTVLMEISFRGIHVIDKRKKNFFQCPTFDFFYSLQNISFCGAHPKQLKYFGFITKHPLLPRFACHVFMSNSTTQPIVESIGRAFKRSYDEYMAFAHPTEDIYLE